MLNLPELLSVEQVAEYLGMKSRSVRQLISRGELNYVRVGARNFRFTEDALSEFVARKTVIHPKRFVDDATYSGLKSALKKNRSLKSRDEAVKRSGDCKGGLAKELRDSWR